LGDQNLRSIRPSTKADRPQLEAGLVRSREQIGRQAIAAARAVFGARREEACKAVAVQVGGQCIRDFGPQRGIAQAQGLRSPLFQTSERVGLEEATDAR
jgi:hypothetical protein